METVRELCGNAEKLPALLETAVQSDQMPFLIAVEALVLIVFSAVATFSVWVVMMVLWFSLHVAIRVAVRRGWMEQLSGPTLRAHLVCVTTFPLVATIWKYSQLRYHLGDGGLPNRVEHFTWAVTMVGQLLPLLARWWTQRRRWEQVIISIGLVSMVGNGVELMEYLAKVPKLRANPLWAMEVYRDTMADITMNVFGAITAALVFAAFASRMARSEDGIARRSDHVDRSGRLADLASGRAAT